MLKNFLKITFRNFRKNRIYSLINITGLALGMICCILILLWVQDELSFDKFHKNNDQLYLLVNQLDGQWGSASPWALSATLKKDYPEIERAARFSEQTMLVKYNSQSFYETAALVDPDFLEMFTFPLIKGNSTTALDVTESVVISENLANKYFKNEDPIGKVLQVNQNTKLSITGIIKNVPSNSSLKFDLLIPVKNIGEEKLAGWAWETIAFVQLKKNISVDDLRTKIAGTTKKYDKRIESKTLINDLQPFSRIHLYSLNGVGPILYVYLFSVIAIIVLIVACINFINLFTASASLRSKEIGVRKVIGAGRTHLIWQFYGETFFLTIIAYIIASTLVPVILPGFNTLTEKQLKIDFTGDPIFIIGAISLILLTTIAAGSYPALLLSSLRPVKILKDSTLTKSRKAAMRWTLVVIQFTASVVLITMTITIVSQIDYIQNKNLGFNREQVISIPLNDDLQNHYESLRNQLLRYPGITNVTSATSSPMNIGYINPVYWEGRGPDQFEYFSYVEMDYDYLETFKIKLAEGRDFSKDFATDKQNYIVNEAAVDFMKMKNPVGKLFSIWTNEGKIIGVVKNFHSQSLHSEIVPIVMTLNKYVPHNSIFLRIKPEDMKSSLGHIENAWKEYSPNYPFQYEFLDETFRQQYMDEERIKSMFQYFSALAIFISCIGLFGLAAFIAQSRTKEIGIRKVVGASVLNLILLMLRDISKWIIISITAAIPIAYYTADKWLQNFAFRIDINWWMFALSGGIALVISLATISFLAVKAATKNPVESLKYE